jgi:hypothetical protein
MNSLERNIERGTDRAVAGRRGRLALLALMLGYALLLVGCSRIFPSSGAYPLDFFPEMHYQQSFKIQEPPSLSAPADSVPITGREVIYTMAVARELDSPFPVIDATLIMGSELYRVNCAVCHGTGGEGDGPMRQRMKDSGYSRVPADLTSAGPTAGKSDGEVFQIISQGFAGAYGMPPESFLMPSYRKLLTSDERWMIIQYIRDTFQK